MEGLRLRGFEAWLRQQNPEDTCGLPANLIHCPLARYLRMTTGLRAVVYGDTYLLFDKWSEFSPTHTRRMRPWAAAFRRLVDGADDRPVSAGLALDYLRRAQKEANEGADVRPSGESTAR